MKKIRFPVKNPEELRGLLGKFEDCLRTEAKYTQPNARIRAKGARLFVDYLDGRLLEKGKKND